MKKKTLAVRLVERQKIRAEHTAAKAKNKKAIKKSLTAKRKAGDQPE